jgi:hypothetical protein
MLVPRHPKEQVGGARLIALKDRLGEHIEVFVFPNLVSVQQHPGDPSLRQQTQYR